MSTAAVLRARFPRAVANLRQYGGAAARGLDEAGQLTWFALTSIGQIAHALRYYRKETLRLIAMFGRDPRHGTVAWNASAMVATLCRVEPGLPTVAR